MIRLIYHFFGYVTVAIEMIANKLFDKYIEKMEAKVGNSLYLSIVANRCHVHVRTYPCVHVFLVLCHDPACRQLSSQGAWGVCPASGLQVQPSPGKNQTGGWQVPHQAHWQVSEYCVSSLQIRNKHKSTCSLDSSIFSGVSPSSTLCLTCCKSSPSRWRPW